MPTLKGVLTFVAGALMATLMLASLILVAALLLNARPHDPTNNDGQTIAILVCGIAVIAWWTMLFSLLRALFRKAAEVVSEVRPFQKIRNLMSQDHQNREKLKDRDLIPTS